jgi:tRNA modification GTPase
MVIYAMSPEDTICALSTPPGEGGIGIIRVSGSRAIASAAAVFRPKREKRLDDAATHTLHFGHVLDPVSGEVVDEALVSVMRGPATYTREDVVEINCHGGMVPLRRTLELLRKTGARLAEPGEFTKRAFLNGRIDLAQAEAVMDIIAARTDRALKAAQEQLQGGLSTAVAALRDRLLGLVAAVEAGIDFPEEDIETGTGRGLADEITELAADVQELLSSASYGRVLRDGFGTAIVGRPNVGKSSLLNALLRQDRAIVTDIPGTTRDVLEECLNIDGILFRILDTAGIRHTVDVVEQEGVRRSKQALAAADIVLVVLDGSRQITDEDRAVLEEAKDKPCLLIRNKSDLLQQLVMPAGTETSVAVSCRTLAGLDELRAALAGLVQRGATAPRDHAWVVNQRHATALDQALAGLRKAEAAARSDLSLEFVALDLREALDSLGLIIGATYTEDILEKIFSDFCIGK